MGCGRGYGEGGRRAWGEGTEAGKREATSISGIIFFSNGSSPSPSGFRKRFYEARLCNSPHLLEVFLPACFVMVISNKILKTKRTCDFFGKTVEKEDVLLYFSSCEILGHGLVRAVIHW